MDQVAGRAGELVVGDGWDVVAGSAITGVLALTALLVVTGRNIRAAAAARIWKERRKAYTAIIEALSLASDKATVVDEGYNGSASFPLPDPHGYDASERSRLEWREAGESWRRTVVQ